MAFAEGLAFRAGALRAAAAIFLARGFAFRAASLFFFAFRARTPSREWRMIGLRVGLPAFFAAGRRRVFMTSPSKPIVSRGMHGLERLRAAKARPGSRKGPDLASRLAGLQSEVTALKILVTGATGVVGRRLIPLLVGKGAEVLAAARSPRAHESLAKLGAAPVNADLFAPDTLRRAAAGCEVIVNLATHMPSSASQMLRRGAWKENDRVRKIGSANLVDAGLAQGVECFIQESFAPAYPDCGNRWIEEDMPLRPAKYNETLLDAERSAARFTKAGGSGVVLRFGSFYGPDSRFLPEAIRQVRRGRAPLPGAANAFLSSVSHDDAARAAAAAVYLPAGVYNVVDDEPLTHREYFDSLARALEVPPPKFPGWWMKWLLGSVGELLARSQRISNRKLKKASAWAPKYPSVREGWADVVAGMGKSGGETAG